jgi:hypothetical protein
MELVGDWFFERNRLNHVTVDDCVMHNGLPCNPTCNTKPDDVTQVNE